LRLCLTVWLPVRSLARADLRSYGEKI
jgi:hypothetical protein